MSGMLPTAFQYVLLCAGADATFIFGALTGPCVHVDMRLHSVHLPGRCAGEKEIASAMPCSLAQAIETG
jgi:hypothetical protein